MEFQFGTNWARFSPLRRRRRSARRWRWKACSRSSSSRAFLGLLVFGERRLGPRGHFARRAARCSPGAGSRATSSSAPTRSCSTRSATASRADGTLHLADFWAFLLNPWALAQYAHTMIAAVVTASFVVAAVGAYYALRGATMRPRGAVPAGVGVDRGPRRRACSSRSRPATSQAKLVARAPAGGAGRDGGPLRERRRRRHRRSSASPTSRERRLDNPIVVPRPPQLPRLRHVPRATSRASNEFPEDQWPDNIELLYYAFHIMVGLGTLLHPDDGRSPRCSCWRGDC